MTLSRPDTPDALRPSEEMALDTWASRVGAADDQIDRCREFDEPTDLYARATSRFRLDPRRRDDVTLGLLHDLSRPDDTWLDIGAGGGRFALPLALSVREVHAVEPSPAMLDVLTEDMRIHGIENIQIREGRWPLEDGEPPRADVVLMAHVGYGVERIGAFLDAAEVASTRSCVTVMGESPMTTAATLLWEVVHGESRVATPAFPEMLALLVARGRFPVVSVAPRHPVVYDTRDGVLAMARRQLRVQPGSSKDEILSEQVSSIASQREEGWSLDWSTTRIGVASWEPPAT